MASFVSALLDASGPALVRMVVVMERAAAASQEVRAGFVAAVERAERDFLPDALKALGQSDLFLAELETSLDTTAAHAQRVPPARGAKNPRPVTRG
jgi:hypothetical protein